MILKRQIRDRCDLKENRKWHCCEVSELKKGPNDIPKCQLRLKEALAMVLEERRRLWGKSMAAGSATASNNPASCKSGLVVQGDMRTAACLFLQTVWA